MRKRLYEILEVGNDEDLIIKVYDVFMMVAIVVSIAPLMTKTENQASFVIDKVTVTIFIADYILRLITEE